MGIKDYTKKLLNPEEILEKMEYCSSRFEIANTSMRNIQEEENLTNREKDVGTILACKRWDLLENPKAKARYQVCCEDEKFKPTKDIIDDYTYLELQDIKDEYFQAELDAKQAEKEYAMWQGQLFWHQSKLKFATAEMMNKID